MDAITYSTARANLAETMDRVCNDHEALIITRTGKPSVVMLSLEDYKALEETAYLLSTPANAERLLSAIAHLNAGKGVQQSSAEEGRSARIGWPGKGKRPSGRSARASGISTIPAENT